MINIPPIKPSTSFTSKLISDVSKTWKVGQVLSATAERGGEALSKVLIRLGQHSLEAKTPVKLETGQDIKLLVKAIGDTQASKLPLLTILPPGSQQPQDKSSLAGSKLRQFIAVQESFSKTQQLIQTLLNNKSIISKLPQPLTNNLLNLQNALPVSPEKMSVGQLKQLVLNSGVFLESKLQSMQTSQATKTDIGNTLQQDFKLNLLNTRSALEISNLLPQVLPNQTSTKLSPALLNQLQQVIQGTSSTTAIVDKLISSLPRTLVDQLVSLLSNPQAKTTASKELQTLVQTLITNFQKNATLQRNSQELQTQLITKLMLLDLSLQVDRSLSQITSFQLQPLSKEPDNLTLLLFNLIFKDKEEMSDMHFRIQQESNPAENANESWQVTINFNFKTLGKVQSLIHLTNEQISTTFHTEQASTSDKIKQLLPVLQNSLTKAGLNVSNLSVINQPIETKLDIHMHTHLLDEKI